MRAGCGPRSAEISEKEMVIDHDDLRELRLALHPGDETPIEPDASRADSGFAGRGDLAPYSVVFRQRAELGYVPDLGSIDEACDGCQRACEHRARRLRAGSELAEATATDVIRNSLHHRGAQRDTERALDQRDISLCNLLLQRAGGRRHNHLFPAEHRGKQVGQGLSSSSARFAQQHPLLAQGALDRFRHRLLAVARFVARQNALESSARPEQVGERAHGRVALKPLRARVTARRTRGFGGGCRCRGRHRALDIDELDAGNLAVGLVLYPDHTAAPPHVRLFVADRKLVLAAEIELDPRQSSARRPDSRSASSRWSRIPGPARAHARKPRGALRRRYAVARGRRLRRR